MNLTEKKILFPFSRIHNPIMVEAHLDNGIIKDAFLSDTLYRGFEQIVIGRPAMDMPYYTERICGICSSAHAQVAALAVEQALGMQVPPNGHLLRNLILAGDFLQNHLRHLYLLAMPDYFKGPDVAPFLPHTPYDLRLSPKEDAQLTEHYFKAFEIARQAHNAFGVFGGKAPHGHGIVAGGVTSDIDADKVSRYRGYLKEVSAFLDKVVITDLNLIADRYPDFLDLGKGNGNYLSGGAFSGLDGSNLFPEGTVIQGKKGHLDERRITEDVTTAWYKQTGPLYPGEGKTIPDRSQPKGYTWIKAPRYQGMPVEVGPLARAVVRGDKVRGYGAVGRLLARALEAKDIALAANEWLNHLMPGEPTLSTKVEQTSGTGVGIFDAMRGLLGHWIEVQNGRIKHYQIVTPSAWNFSSRDESGTRSVAESSILNIKVTNDFIEAGRVIRSYDPCFSCTVHILEGDKKHSFDLPV